MRQRPTLWAPALGTEGESERPFSHRLHPQPTFVMAHDTIEVYVRELSEDAAIEWLREVFDGMTQVGEEPIVTYEGDYDGTPVPVQITEHVENGPYTSLWFNAPTMPWDSATACAREAHEGLGREVLCFLNDPERPWVLLRVTDEGEEYVDKGTVEL